MRQHEWLQFGSVSAVSGVVVVGRRLALHKRHVDCSQCCHGDLCNYECHRLGKSPTIYTDLSGKKTWIHLLNTKCITTESVKARKPCALIIYSSNDAENCKTNHGRTERASYFACLLEGINTLKIKDMHILNSSEYNFMWNKLFNV